MAPRSREDKTELQSSPMLADTKPDYSLLAGEYFSLKYTSTIRDGNFNGLIQRILHRDCGAVCKLATSRMPELSKVAGKIGKMIAADMEARLLRAARAKGRGNSSRNKGRNSGSMYTWASDILEWTESQPLPLNNENDKSNGGGDSDGSDESQYSNDSELVGLDADYVAPFFESFMLFVAHLISEYFMSGSVSELLDPEDCRLILPIAGCDMEDEDSDASSVAYVDPADFAAFEYSLFPIGSSMERQVAPAPHLVVGGVEVVRHKSDYGEAEQRLAKKTKALFFNQHNRCFAWGLTARSCTVRAYIFGMDDI
ncbi:hypothetical protein GGI06_000405 [Coemansia sp. S85]|nr:hypothetical protein GGI06_000405 [Coemansia sp. S85]